MNDLPTWKKAAIGAIGGLSLALLKLIDPLGGLGGNIEGPYATAIAFGGYPLLGAAAAGFLADHEGSPQKMRRGAFLLGLLAPSVLVAYLSGLEPDRASPPAKAPIPQLSWLPIGAAQAQATPLPAAPPLKVVPREALQPRLSDSAWAAFGRSTYVPPYALVVGSTEERDKALKTATEIRQVLESSAPAAATLAPQVVQIKGQSRYFVVLGGIGSHSSAVRAKGSAAAAAIQAVRAPATGANALTAAQQQDIASLLANAPVVSARALAAGN